MKTTTQHQVRLGNRRVEYRVIHSATAQKLRVRVGPHGVDVVKPRARNADDILVFLDQNADWLTRQIERIEKLGSVRRSEQLGIGEILYRGEPTTIRIERPAKPTSRSTVHFIHGNIVILQSTKSATPIGRTLELWLRRQARS